MGPLLFDLCFVELFAVKTIVYQLDEPPALIASGIEFFKLFFVGVPIEHKMSK